MTIKIYSTTWCADCIRSKYFLDSKKIAYESIDIEEHPEFIETVKQYNNGNQTIPTIVITKDDGSQVVLSEPSNDELEKAVM